MLESIDADWVMIAFVIIILYALYQRKINEIERYYRKEIRERENLIHELEEEHASDIELESTLQRAFAKCSL